MFEGLTSVNIELTSRCNKQCPMCGRRKIERDYPELAKWGDMDYELVEEISRQIPHDIVVQFHDNGEPLLYPRLGDALVLFDQQVTCLDTNGKLLIEKADEIIGNLDTITISVIENDDAIEADNQYANVREFMRRKASRKPFVIARILGNVDASRYKELGCIIATRTLHSPMGSFGYRKPPTVPEIGICLDFLNHLAIKRDGSVSFCVRFDPHRQGVLGNLKDNSLAEIWHGKLRETYKQWHIQGRRDKVPLCDKCEYWGIPVP